MAKPIVVVFSIALLLTAITEMGFKGACLVFGLAALALFIESKSNKKKK